MILKGINKHHRGLESFGNPNYGAAKKKKINNNNLKKDIWEQCSCFGIFSNSNNKVFFFFS